MFGDNVIGRRPKDNSVIVVEYRISNGELPNGLRTFFADGAIGGETDITITTVSPAYGGSVRETIDEIKFNAPRAFTTQERAVTTEDYETLLKQYFPEINVVSAYGGEEADPPQYGKVFISLDLEELDGLPSSKIDIYKKFIKQRSPLSIDPVFIEPEYLYTSVVAKVKYNINTTTLSANDIKLLVISAILSYSDRNLDDFKATLRYSQLVRAIDDSHASIISNETEIYALKKITPALNSYQSINLNFNAPLYNALPSSTLVHKFQEDTVITSSKFVSDSGEICTIEDDGKGGLRLVSIQEGQHNTTKYIGTVNYDTGQLTLTNFKVINYLGTGINIYAKPRIKDIFSTTNSILSIIEEDIVVEVEQVKE